MTRKASNTQKTARHVAAIFGTLLLMPGCAAQSPADRLQALRAAENARAHEPETLAPILSALGEENDTLLQRAAVRALGRLQRPAYVDTLARFLAHESEGIRIEAANAIAQSVQPGGESVAVERAKELLLNRLTAKTDTEQGSVARSLGRLPLRSPAASQDLGERIASAIISGSDSALPCTQDVRRATFSADSVSAAKLYGALHGIYAIARRTRQLGCNAAMFAEVAAAYKVAATTDTAVWVREIAILALQAANRSEPALLLRAIEDKDPRVRRLALRVSRETPAATLLRLASKGLADSAAMVRIEATRPLALQRSPESCALARRALNDRNPHVRGEAIDATTAACDSETATHALGTLVRQIPDDTVAIQGTWHAPARALGALARITPELALRMAVQFRRHPVWQVRAALAAAARQAGDTTLLLDLLEDSNANVREETITHLAAMGPAVRDRAVQAGLRDSAYQVVLAAAQAAEEAPAIDVAALDAALSRLTAMRQETSRDPRRALLERIAQRGTAADSALLRPYLSDFDTLIARRAAETLSRWTGLAVRAAPRPLPIRPESPGAARELVITLSESSGGGSWRVRLFPDEAPATVGRITRLARDGYYNGLTLHRVVPNFVIQGGGPGANEYVGDGPFMRDELGLRSHTRGTLGISTRGRDTGDAQIFVNLIDNFRLDHDYTVFGEIVEGMEVVDRVQAGAVIARIQVIDAQP